MSVNFGFSFPAYKTYTGATPGPRPLTGCLLQENGSRILQEDGFCILLEPNFYFLAQEDGFLLLQENNFKISA